MSVNKELQELKIIVTRVETQLLSFMGNTTEFRQTLAEKVESLDSKINLLPCAERKGWYRSMSKQMNWLWKVTGAIALALAIGFFTHILGK